MYPLTNRLKRYARKNFGVAENASDADFRRVIGAKLMSGKLTPAQLNTLTEAKDAPVKVKSKAKVKAKTAKKKVSVGGDDDDSVDMKTLIRRGVKKEMRKLSIPGGNDDLTPEKLFASGTTARVKSAAEQYSTTTKAALYPSLIGKTPNGCPHPKAGQPAAYMGRTLQETSDLGKAIVSAWLKWNITNGGKKSLNDMPQNLRLTDHDIDLVKYAINNLPFTGFVKGTTGTELRISNRKLQSHEVKALLDDTISGGIEVTPVVFDDAIITFPILFGELFPFVNVVNIPRGRRVKSGTLQNAGFTSGSPEGQPITPFNTAAFIGAFDTPIYAATGAMEIGLDFEEDSPVDLGSTIIQKYGEKALEWLDRVIAVGNGYNEPLGFFNTPGLANITSDNGIAGPPTVSDYQAMMAAVGKQYRNEAGAMLAYVANDTSYWRARSIQVGTNDERRVFGMEVSDYQLFGKKYAVQNDIPNFKQAFVNLRRYRMYRRLGLNVRVETAGRSLALSNTKLLVLRMRYGGQMETANAMSLISDAQE